MKYLSLYDLILNNSASNRPSSFLDQMKSRLHSNKQYISELEAKLVAVRLENESLEAMLAVGTKSGTKVVPESIKTRPIRGDEL